MIHPHHQERRQLAGGDQLCRGFRGPPGVAAEGKGVVKQVLAVVQEQQGVGVAAGLLAAVACSVSGRYGITFTVTGSVI